VQKDNQLTEAQSSDLPKIETIEELLRERGFFDAESENVEREKQNEGVLVH
jgi:hypothetical protein